MSSTNSSAARAPYSDHALVAWLSSLTEGRRVVVLGPRSGELARRFRALGARTVLALGGSGEGIAVRALTPGAVAALRGRVDVLVVPELEGHSMNELLDEARTALGADGVLVMVSHVAGAPAGAEASSAGPSFEAAQEALASRFGVVRMAGRGTFLGYLVAPLDEGAEAPTLDTRLMPDDAPAAESVVFLASDEELTLEALTVVQVPAHEVLASMRAADVGGNARALELEQAVEQREARALEAEKAAAERWVQLQRMEHDLRGSNEDLRKAREKAVRLTKDLDDERKLRQRTELDAQLRQRAPDEGEGLRAELARVRAEQEKARKDAQASEQRAAELARELDETQATESELRAALDEAEKRAADRVRKEDSREVTRLRGELEAAKGEAARVTRLQSEARTLEQEHRALEQRLAERGRRVQQLEKMVSERDVALRELSYAVDQAAGESELAIERTRAAELSALTVALADEGLDLARQNELLRRELGASGPSTGEPETAPPAPHEELERCRRAVEAAEARASEAEKARDEARLEASGHTAKASGLQERLAVLERTYTALRGETDESSQVLAERARVAEATAVRVRNERDLMEAGFASRLVERERELAEARAKAVPAQPPMASGDGPPRRISSVFPAPLNAAVAERDALRAECDALRVELAEGKRTMQELEQAVSQARGELERHSDRADGLQRALNEAHAAEERAHQRADGLSSSTQALKDEVQQLREGITEASNALQGERQRQGTVDRRVEHYAQEVATLTAALADARGQLAQSSPDDAREKAQLRQQLEEQRGQTTELSALTEQLRGALEDERRRGGDGAAQHASVRAQAERAEARASAAEASLEAARRRLDDEHAQVQTLSNTLAEARVELARQLAMHASLDDRAQQLTLELQGARSGYKRRIAELLRETEQLVQALELTSAQGGREQEDMARGAREVQGLGAYAKGLELRLADAELAVRAAAQVQARVDEEKTELAAKLAGALSDLAQTQHELGLAQLEQVRTSSPLDETVDRSLVAPLLSGGPAGMSQDQLLADLAETAARLAQLEELLDAERHEREAVRARSMELELLVDRLRRERDAATDQHETTADGPVLDELQREAGERELLVRSLVAQLEDRDLRLKALERRLVEEVERARRTESEIWEAELRARDQRITLLVREATKARGEGSAAQAPDPRLQELRETLERLREGLSAILIDGRGAVVAHDLVTLLRQIEDTPGMSS